MNDLNRGFGTTSFVATLVVALGIFSGVAHASDPDPNDSNCEPALTAAGVQKNEAVEAKPAPKKSPRKTAVTGSAAYQRLVRERGEQSLRAWKLEDFFTEDEASNLALAHPFTIANAAEKSYAMLTYVPPMKAKDPLYGLKDVMVYPMVTGHKLANGRMVVGNEEAIDALVNFLGSLARGDRSGKAFGFPGPAGTGKTELLYVIDNIERNLSKADSKFKQFSYRWQNLNNIPVLQHMFKFDRATGKPVSTWIDPDMPRSPFTLLRSDMKDELVKKLIPRIRQKWNMTISKGWLKTEPKSRAIIKAILQHKYPEIAQGLMTEDDLSREEYLAAINEFLVIVPKETVQNKVEPQIIRAQTEDPNFEALFARPNLMRQAFYAGGEMGDLAVDYSGQVFQQDGGLLMLDELYRNPESLLNLLLEVKQNRMVQTDYSDPVEVDIVPIWNSNDESIEKAKEDMALKASIDRDQPRAMRLLLDPEQIEATAAFQVDPNRFVQRELSRTELKPMTFEEVYPAPDTAGKTQTAYGRYALYYQSEGDNLLIAPLTLNYMSWLAAATRYETDITKMQQFGAELNLVMRNPGLFVSPITRLKIALGEREVTSADKRELYKISNLLEEGRNGISARDIETWYKNALAMAIRTGKGVLTPRMMDEAFEAAITSGEIKVPNTETRAKWQAIRMNIKMELLLPKLEKDVRMIISGDGDKANRIYDEVEREFLELAQNPQATQIQPDDGSQPLLINMKRLEMIRAAYRKRNGRAFEPTFLMRNLQGARSTGHVTRDPDLLEAVRDFLAETDAVTTDSLSLFAAHFKGENKDPMVSEKVSLVMANLSKYGYDEESFKEAVYFAYQLTQQRELMRQPRR